jgi:hypothetical protein
MEGRIISVPVWTSIQSGLKNFESYTFREKLSENKEQKKIKGT